MLRDILVGLASIVVLGIAAQWLAWRLKSPSILFLLIVGYFAGPVAGLIDPDALLGDLLFPIVSLSVAIILFEGGLSLNIAELREIGKVVRNLVSVGVLVTWVLVGILAHVLLGFSLPLSALLGAILVVTGPTVIGPLLRHIRPEERIGSAVKWEGIVNDPIGAILAVLVFEIIVAGGFEKGAAAAALGILEAVTIGGVLGIIGAGVIVLFLSRHWVPDFLQNPIALAVVLLVFTGSNLLQEESGLLTVTVMGSALASQKMVMVGHIVEFKENLRVLLLSTLFIVLAGRLPALDPVYTSTSSFLFLGGLVLIVRPTAVALSTLGSKLNWRERTFLGLMAPRGIVAAAVSSLFALELVELGYGEAERLVPVTFLVIVGTVAFYGLFAPPLARWMRLATPNPQGLLIVGAAPWTRRLAELLVEEEVRVVLLDANWTNVAAARRAGLLAYYLNILSERAVDDVDLSGIGRLVALTPNDEVNALAALRFEDLFGRSGVFQLPPAGSDTGDGRIARHLGGRMLFASGATHRGILDRVAKGAVITKHRLTDQFDYEAFQQRYGSDAIPMFLIRDPGDVMVFTTESRPTPKPGHTLISLVTPVTEPQPPE